MGLDVEPRLTIEKVEAPSERAGGVILESVDELLEKLKNEAKVIWGDVSQKTKVWFDGHEICGINFNLSKTNLIGKT